MLETDTFSSGIAEVLVLMLRFKSIVLPYLTCNVVIETFGGSGLSALVLLSLSQNGISSGLKHVIEI